MSTSNTFQHTIPPPFKCISCIMTNHLEVDSAAFHLVLSIKQHGAVRLHLEKYVMYLGSMCVSVCVVTEGHSTTKWTKFYTILTPSIHQVDKYGHFPYYPPFVT